MNKGSGAKFAIRNKLGEFVRNASDNSALSPPPAKAIIICLDIIGYGPCLPSLVPISRTGRCPVASMVLRCPLI
jgi:hypothetical protein